jgi:hypothetical protein
MSELLESLYAFAGVVFIPQAASQCRLAYSNANILFLFRAVPPNSVSRSSHITRQSKLSEPHCRARFSILSSLKVESHSLS